MFTAWIAQFEGNAETALELFAALGGIDGAWGRSVALWDLGRDEASTAAIEELIELNAEPTRIAMAYAYRDDHDKAFEWLERGYAERDDWLIETRMFIPMQNLTDDPRWNALLTRLGIDDESAKEVF